MNSNPTFPIIVVIALCIFLIRKIAKGKSANPVMPQKNQRTFLEIVAFCGLIISPISIIYVILIFGGGTAQDNSNGETFIVLSFLIGLVSLITLIVLAIKNHWRKKIK